MLYRVSHNDTPATIATKFTGNPARARELFQANTHKPFVSLGGVPTFQALRLNEILNVPRHWARNRNIPGTLGQGAIIDLATVKGVQQTINQTTATTIAVDGIYGPQTTAGVTAIQQADGTVTVDGKFGPETRKVAASFLDAGGIPYTNADSVVILMQGSQDPGSGGGGGGGGGGTVPVPPPPVPTPTPAPASAKSNLALYAVGTAAAIGVGALVYMSTRKRGRIVHRQFHRA